MFAANLPAHVRHSKRGAEVAGLVPSYQKHSQPEASSSDPEHAKNAKRLLWAAYDQLLAPLTPERCQAEEQSQFVQGFRFV